MEGKKQSNIIWVAIAGFIVVAAILIIGTVSMGRSAGRDTETAVHNVSLLYLDELAQRRQQVVSTTISGYVSDINIALRLMEAEDLRSKESLQAYQGRIKQLYRFERFAFVDESGMIYTSTGTRTDIDSYDFDYNNISSSKVFVKGDEAGERRVVIAMSVDHLPYCGHELVALLVEIDMNRILEEMSLRGDTNNNTTFCNLYTKDGVALTDAILGGLASEDNLLLALENATMMKGYSAEQVRQDFAAHTEGFVSFSYNGIHETLYYVPVSKTDWMLTYLIREGLISDQMSQVAESTIKRSVIQSLLTALVLILVFSVLIWQIRRNGKIMLESEVLKTENLVRQQELEEQVAMQEELRDQEKQLSEALRAAEDANLAKSRFVSDMSHEIRTPITAILGMNEMIHRESDDEVILGYSDTIEKAGTSLLGIISDILDFSKIESGKLELVEVCYSIHDMVRDLYNLVHFRADSKGLGVELDIDETMPRELYGDELRVKQIIANLLTNAVKYTEEGSVRLSIRRESSFDETVTMYVEVVDTGIGIRPEDMEKLFSSFERLESERNRTIEGTGLGLSITAQLLELMGSRLQVESTYDVGSKFYFTVKQGIADSKAAGAFDLDALDADAVAKRRPEVPFYAPDAKILIVDDTPMNLQVISALLKRTGMDIDMAASGEQCIELFEKNDYDVVFLDYRMPGLDGIETILEIEKRFPEKFEHTAVVSLTASAVSGDRERMLEAGFDDYLTKPVNASEMENVLRNHVPQHKQKDAPDAVDKTAGSDDGKADAFALPKALLETELLDIKKGIEYCGDEEDYLEALKTYRDSVEDRSSRLSNAFASGDIDAFTIEVHSLKSMSMAVGAFSVGSMAKELEEAGKDKDVKKIESLLPSLLSDYKKVLEFLKAAIE